MWGVNLIPGKSRAMQNQAAKFMRVFIAGAKALLDEITECAQWLFWLVRTANGQISIINFSWVSRTSVFSPGTSAAQEAISLLAVHDSSIRDYSARGPATNHPS